MGKHEFKFEHGVKVRDMITGFTGVITGRANYITGCDQYLLAPPIDKEGKHVDALWYDDNRLDIVEREPIELNDSKENRACEPTPIK